MAATTAAPADHDPDGYMSNASLLDVVDVKFKKLRRPVTGDTGDYWYCSRRTWDDSLRSIALGDIKAVRRASNLVHTFDACGRMKETNEGMDAATPCTRCAKARHPCRVFKYFDSKMCAYCRRNNKSGCTTSHKPAGQPDNPTSPTSNPPESDSAQPQIDDLFSKVELLVQENNNNKNAFEKEISDMKRHQPIRDQRYKDELKRQLTEEFDKKLIDNRNAFEKEIANLKRDQSLRDQRYKDELKRHLEEELGKNLINNRNWAMKYVNKRKSELIDCEFTQLADRAHESESYVNKLNKRILDLEFDLRKLKRRVVTSTDDEVRDDYNEDLEEDHEDDDDDENDEVMNYLMAEG